MHACVSVCVRACVRACVHVCSVAECERTGLDCLFAIFIITQILLMIVLLNYTTKIYRKYS